MRPTLTVNILTLVSNEELTSLAAEKSFGTDSANKRTQSKMSSWSCSHNTKVSARIRPTRVHSPRCLHGPAVTTQRSRHGFGQQAYTVQDVFMVLQSQHKGLCTDSANKRTQSKMSSWSCSHNTKVSARIRPTSVHSPRCLHGPAVTTQWFTT